MHKQSKMTALILGTAVWLTACSASTESCDPKYDPGFFSKIGCIASGSYAARTEQKKNDISVLRDELKAVSDETVALNDKNALINEDRAQSRRRLDRLEEKIADLKEQNAAKSVQNAKLNAEIDRVQSQISKMKNMPENASVLEKRHEKAVLEQELDDLLSAQAE